MTRYTMPRRAASLFAAAAVAATALVAIQPAPAATADAGAAGGCGTTLSTSASVDGSTVTFPASSDPRYFSTTYTLGDVSRNDAAGPVVFTDVPPGIQQFTAQIFYVSPGIDAFPYTASVVVGEGRISGSDRFATAAAIDATIEGYCEVYLTSGLNFPDALASVPVADRMLLTRPEALPAATLERLAANPPERIILTGGPTTISTAVEQQLVELGYDVRRIAGDHRYDTALRIAESHVWRGYTDVDGVFHRLPALGAYVVTGEKFPDAVSAGSAGARTNVPVILVPGSQASIPSDWIDRIRATVDGPITIVGDEGSVSAGIQQQLTSAGFDVDRVAGANRYATNAALVASLGLVDQDNAIVATGFRFPDALAGGILAVGGGPVLLAPQSCVVPETRATLTAIGDPQTILLGDARSVTAGVTDRLC